MRQSLRRSQQYLIICVYPISWSCTGRRVNDAWKYIPKYLSKKHRVIFYTYLDPPLSKRQFVRSFFTILQTYIRSPLIIFKPAGGPRFQAVHWFVVVFLLGIRRNIIILSGQPDSRVFDLVWWKRSLCVYDCTDQLCDMSNKHKDALIKKEEQDFIHQCDLTFVNSPALFTLKHTYSLQVRLVPAGFPVKSYFSPTHRGQQKKNRTIVYIGAISFRFDFDLLTYVIQKNKEYQFLFIGPYLDLDNDWQKHIDAIQQTRNKWNEITKLPNVRYIGYLKRSDIQAMSKDFDIGIIPYDGSQEFNRYSNPVKFYDYVGMGLPVVTTDILALRSYTGVLPIRIAHTKYDFNRYIRKPFRLSQRDRQKAQSVVKENDITRKIDIMLQEITQQTIV
jgi:Glycosyl transferases group 1